MEDKIYGGWIDIVPCGLREDGIVESVDVVINDELFHVEIPDPLVEWMVEMFNKKRKI